MQVPACRLCHCGRLGVCSLIHLPLSCSVHSQKCCAVLWEFSILCCMFVHVEIEAMGGSAYALHLRTPPFNVLQFSSYILCRSYRVGNYCLSSPIYLMWNMKILRRSLQNGRPHVQLYSPQRYNAHTCIIHP